jgi:hypothetical protein
MSSPPPLLGDEFSGGEFSVGEFSGGEFSVGKFSGDEFS